MPRNTIMHLNGLNVAISPFKIIIITCITFSISCKKFIAVNAPIDQINSNIVFSNDATAISAVTGLYSQMSGSYLSFASGAITLYAGLSSDELYSPTPNSRIDPFTENVLLKDNPAVGSSLWQPAYQYIYTTNAILEGLQKSTLLSAPLKDQLEGEAKLTRAFCYFYLINFFGEIPLEVSTNYTLNSTIPRSQSNIIYDQIISDLKDAEALLSPVYPSSGRVRPNKWAAASLLARVYLYQAQWENAINEASEVINSGMYTLEQNPDDVFITTSNEAIWQLAPVSPGFNTNEGNYFIPYSADIIPAIAVTDHLVSAFEAGDLRKKSWLDSNIVNSSTYFYPFKYKVGSSSTITENYVLLRLAEQLLIRAEANARLNNLTDALGDLNLIRNRAGLPNKVFSTQADLLSSIQHEREVELFAEWGHRWFDLKRTGLANEVLSAEKPASWQASDTLYPIPLSEIELNPALTQNIGY